jgi:hypothetical protein
MAPAAQSSLARIEGLVIYWSSWNWLGAKIARCSMSYVGQEVKKRQTRKVLNRTSCHRLQGAFIEGSSQLHDLAHGRPFSNTLLVCSKVG